MIIIGDDWAQNHHDIELMTQDGAGLARFRVPENAEGLGTLPARLSEHMTVTTKSPSALNETTDPG